jgi:hypothetical protein
VQGYGRRELDAVRLVDKLLNSKGSSMDALLASALPDMLDDIERIERICSVAITPDLRDCTRANATVVMRVPADFGNPVTCFMHGQAYLAQTTMGRELGEDERVKVVCARGEMIDASIRRLGAR